MCHYIDTNLIWLTSLARYAQPTLPVPCLRRALHTPVTMMRCWCRNIDLHEELTETLGP